MPRAVLQRRFLRQHFRTSFSVVCVNVVMHRVQERRCSSGRGQGRGQGAVPSDLLSVIGGHNSTLPVYSLPLWTLDLP